MKKSPPTTEKSAKRKLGASRPKVLRVPRVESPRPSGSAFDSTPLFQAFSEALSVGHRPAHTLSPQDEALFRSFQANLLSLISHELRTPLMGILNALSVLDSADASSGSEFSARELVHMARQNANRLHRTLATLLDLASLESGVFHPRLREVDLERLARARVEAQSAALAERGLTARVSVEDAEALHSAATLADPQKLGRALDLCLQGILPRARENSPIQFRISLSGITLEFGLAAGGERAWDDLWSQGLAGFHGGVGSPTSLFGGVLQSEQAFLSRMEEGLGSELILAHEILRLHGGSLAAERSGGGVRLRLLIPRLSSEEGLRAVLSSRAFEVSTELGSVALVLIRVPEGVGAENFLKSVKNSLFRATDAAYALPALGQVALVLDDCKPEDAPRLLSRIARTLKQDLVTAIAHCPSDAQDPAILLDLAQAKLRAGGALARDST